MTTNRYGYKLTLRERAEQACDRRFRAVWPADVSLWLSAYRAGHKDGKAKRRKP